MSLKNFALIPQRRFWPVMATQSLGTFTDNGLKWGLLTLANYYGLTVFDLGKDQTINIASLMFTIPMMLFPAYAGTVADRVDKHIVMRRAKLAEIFIMLIAGIGLILANAFILMSTLFMMGVQSAFYAPARTASIPQYLRDEELVGGNAILNGALSMFILIGTITGMKVITLDGGRWILAGLLFGVAILGFLSSTQLLRAPSAQAKGKGVVGETGEFFASFFRLIYNLVTNLPVTRPLLGVAWYWAVSTIVVTMLPIYINDNLGYGQSVVQTIFILFVVCGALGAIICAILNKGRDGLIFALVGTLGLAVFSLDLYLTRETGIFEGRGEIAEFWATTEGKRFLIDCGGAALFGGMYTVPLIAMAQRRANPEKRGRLLAGMTVLNAVGATVGLIVLIVINSAGLPRISAFIPVVIISLLIAAYVAYRMKNPSNAPTYAQGIEAEFN